MEKFKLSYGDIVGGNPSVIYVGMPMIGADGPAGSYRGVGRTIGALTGIHGLTGYSPTDVTGPGTHFPDHAANPGHALIATLAALLHRRSTGEGAYIQLSQVHSTLQLLGPYILQYGSTGIVPEPEGNKDLTAAPYGVFKCGEGWLALSVRRDTQWVALCLLMGSPELASHPAYLDQTLRHANVADVNAEVAVWLQSQEPFDAASRLQAAGVPAAPLETARAIKVGLS